MDIDRYLLDQEEVRGSARVEVDIVAESDRDWYVTSERVIKHTSGFLSNEEFHDLSLEKVHGISLRTGRQNGLLGLGLLFAVVGLIPSIIPPGVFPGIGSIRPLSLVVGIVSLTFFGVLWYVSKSSYLQIHGPDSPGRWEIESGRSASAPDRSELKDLAMVIREEVSE